MNAPRIPVLRLPRTVKKRHSRISSRAADPRGSELLPCELCGHNPRKKRGRSIAYRFCDECLTLHGGTEAARAASRTRKAALRTEAEHIHYTEEQAAINEFYENWPLRGTSEEHAERLARHRTRLEAIGAL